MSGGGASDTPNAEKFIEPEKEPHYDGHWTMLRMLIADYDGGNDAHNDDDADYDGDNDDESGVSALSDLQIANIVNVKLVTYLIFVT